ncbi:hypothetical protein [Roseibium aggregatum]|uniref:Outer membrane protein n=1 Tax=Roseibium aggregatum TaxID=187304 RepID=A0A939EDE9_9HYPH|nr:hypothetical protein [Roseibium aggregatum]MBN9671251.1 hypothetical protein [Roseibium aggregatum]
MLKDGLSTLAGAVAIVATQLPALAADLPLEPQPAPSRIVEDRWTFKVTPYLWAASLNAETRAGDSLELPFRDVLKNLNIALMATAALEKGRFGFYSDLVYMHLEGSESTTANLVNGPLNARLDVTMQSFITTNSLGYAFVETPSTEIAGFGGFRYLWLKTDLDFSLGGFSASASTDGQVIDAVAGLRGETRLADRWSVVYYGDIGTGQSDLTWQLYGAVGYDMKYLDLFAGYRYMGWRFDDVANLDSLDVHGPVIGARFRF